MILEQCWQDKMCYLCHLQHRDIRAVGSFELPFLDDEWRRIPACSKHGKMYKASGRNFKKLEG